MGFHVDKSSIHFCAPLKASKDFFQSLRKRHGKSPAQPAVKSIGQNSVTGCQLGGHDPSGKTDGISRVIPGTPKDMGPAYGKLPIPFP